MSEKLAKFSLLENFIFLFYFDPFKDLKNNQIKAPSTIEMRKLEFSSESISLYLARCL